ncbi:cilia- and flagella-associated 46-like [Brachionus plicatilis]|uniref:Cilia-and flagella-associated 46-like n=1 Tax=Brachionus plicatilis TaxID=10195 RepID=A0A3M7PWP1_BRAPC|nr:cilia- and flagella-associated 46-like [Brachionus plicatilis]
MDSPIYRLLARAEQEKNVEFVREAYYQLDPEISSKNEKSTKDIENFSQNLFVECAEKALNFNEHQIANRCIQIYFSLPMISNQFLARAYLCQFQLLAPKSTFEASNLDKSTPFLHKAIDFSIQNKRYNFLIYNSSLIFWKYARSFIKTNFTRLLCPSLKIITQALQLIDDPDHEWRAFLEKTLIEAYLDSEQISEASSLASDLLNFVQKHLPDHFEEYFEFIINKNLIDDEELKALTVGRWELDIIYRIERLKKPSKLRNQMNILLIEYDVIIKNIKSGTKVSKLEFSHKFKSKPQLNPHFICADKNHATYEVNIFDSDSLFKYFIFILFDQFDNECNRMTQSCPDISLSQLKKSFIDDLERFFSFLSFRSHFLFEKYRENLVLNADKAPFLNQVYCIENLDRY